MFSGSLVQLCHPSAVLQCLPYPFTTKHELRIFICMTFQIQKCSAYIYQLSFAIKMSALTTCSPGLALVVHLSNLPNKSLCSLTDTSIFAWNMQNFTLFPLLNPFLKHCSDNRHCLEHWWIVTSIYATSHNIVIITTHFHRPFLKIYVLYKNGTM